DAISSQLRDAWSIASVLRKKRFKEGALELDMPEARVKVDREGKAIGILREENDISHQMIEEFMLLANNLVAKDLRERSIPAVYRVHEDPDAQKLLEFRELVKSHGIAVGDLTQRREMQAFLARLTDRAEGDVLKVALLRSLRKAIYAPKPAGHYGLAKADYTHFTSPIRRYSDLIVHRAFTFGLLRQKAKLPRSVDLPSICEHISKTERIAADAEREAVRLKKLEFFSGLIGKPHRLTGTVVDVRNYGLMVEVKEAIITGLIHISSLDDDFFIFDPANQRVIGRKTKVTFKIGDSVEVRVVRTDLFKHQIDLELAA
ncbi:MAG: RNB domain-containing ribonuclease, partial [Verrucomicrobia bacterium]|nr:RNB domain-containing ribonuclease [Verrucomicrobiota bacterium]